MNNMLIFIILITLLIVADSFALTGITYYKTHKHLLYILGPIVLYGLLTPYLLIKILDYEQIGTINFIWNVASTIIMIIVSYYLFNEKINRLKLISFIMGITSLVLLYMSEN